MKEVQPDLPKVRSLLEAAKKDMNYTLTLKISSESASTIIRNIYECFRMLGEADLLTIGIKADDHVETINRLTRLTEIDTPRSLQILDHLRRTRHRINYDGYQPRIVEVKDALAIVQAIFEPVCVYIEKKL